MIAHRSLTDRWKVQFPTDVATWFAKAQEGRSVGWPPKHPAAGGTAHSDYSICAETVRSW